jgi:hypothetical protein
MIKWGFIGHDANIIVRKAEVGWGVIREIATSIKEVRQYSKGSWPCHMRLRCTSLALSRVLDAGNN